MVGRRLVGVDDVIQLACSTVNNVGCWATSPEQIADCHHKCMKDTRNPAQASALTSCCNLATCMCVCKVMTPGDLLQPAFVLMHSAMRSNKKSKIQGYPCQAVMTWPHHAPCLRLATVRATRTRNGHA